jgi:hypothetical protein
MFDVSMMIALQRSQERVREELYGERCPGAALEVTGGTPFLARQDVSGGLWLKQGLKQSRSCAGLEASAGQ